LIEVHDRRIAADLDFVQDCSINSVDFSNLSDPPGTANWDFGDGSTSSLPDPTHVYTPGASYTVSLTVTDSSTCNFSDTKDTTLFAFPELIAEFILPPEGCAPWTLNPDNTSSSSVADFLWELGDGLTSTEFEPSWTLNPGGSYTVTLIATDSLTCNQVDTFDYLVDIGITPLANFETTTAEPIPGSPVVFLDESTDATTWNWDFGDGNTVPDCGQLRGLLDGHFGGRL
jgi:PKD repeat protein